MESANPIETDLRAAEEGVVAVQFIVGLDHLEGYSVEKDERSAYNWLRMAEENSGTIGQRSHSLVEELRSTVKMDDINAVEQNGAIGVQENRLLSFLSEGRPKWLREALPHQGIRFIPSRVKEYMFR